MIIINNIPKQIVEIIFPIERYPSVFANFSFAFTLLSFTGIFLSAIGLVIYPLLNKSNEKEKVNSYGSLNSIIIFFVFLLISAFYPMSLFVNEFLPNYSLSIKYFYILAPGVDLTSSITVIKHNYFKAMRKNLPFLYIGIGIIVIQIVLILALFKLFDDNIIFIAVATVITQFVWY